MAEIDPVIVKLTADVAKYNRDIADSTRRVDKNLNDQGKSVKRLEREMRSSVDGMSTSLKGLAATFAAGFGVSQLAGLLDSFTRIQNSLKVAGLEGARLKAVQDQLLAQSVKYGVSLEEVAKLYGGVSQAAADLGVTSQQTVQITEATAQALKITGTTAVQAQGAILGLVQALSAGKVTTEEYNQMNEGGLRPLLQLAANTEKYQGSLTRLKMDLASGALSSKNLANAILEGADALGSKAAKAALTLSGAMEGLNSQLVVYFGEADKANGVSAALAEAIKAIADNLDTLIPIMATLIAAMGVRYVVGALAAAGATGVLSLALSSLKTLGIAAVLTGIAAFINDVREASGASDQYKNALEAAGKSAADTSEIIDKLVTATGEARNAALEAAKAKREQAQADLEAAEAALANAEAQRVLADVRNQSWLEQATRGVMAGEYGAVRNPQAEAGARQDANVKAAQETVIRLRQELADLRDAISGTGGGGGATAGTEKAKKSRQKAARSMATAEDQLNELDRLAMEELQARLAIADTAEQRKELEETMLAKEREIRIRQIESDERYTRAQKDAQIAAINRLYGDGTGTIGPVGAPINRQYEQTMADVGRELLRLQQESLEDAAALEPNRAKRAELERNALQLQQEIDRQLFEESILRGELANLNEQQLAQARAAFNASQAAQTTLSERQNESPLQRRRRELSDQASNMNEAIEQVQVDAMDRFADSIANASQNFIKLGGIAGDVVNGIISDLVRLAAQQAITGLFGGGGIGGIAGSIFGARAAGGSVVGGAGYLVGENGPEIFRPNGSGRIIPNRQLRNMAVSGGGGAVIKQTVNVDARNSVNPQGFAQQILSMSNVQAQQAAASMGQAVNKNIPNRISNFQRDGT